MVPERLLPQTREFDREGLQGPDQGLPQALAAARRQRRRAGRPQAQEPPQLRVPEVEDHAAVAGPLLPLGEPGEVGRVVVRRPRLGGVGQPQSAPAQPVGGLDVLPGGIRETLVERLLHEPPPREREVRGVEEVERHLRRVLDQRVSELQAVLVQVVEEGGAPHARVPAGVADDGDLVAAALPPPALFVRREPAGIRHRDVAEECDPGRARGGHAAVARHGRAERRLGESAQRALAAPLPQQLRGPVGRAVVDDDDLERRRIALRFEPGEHLREHGTAVVGRDHHRVTEIVEVGAVGAIGHGAAIV